MRSCEPCLERACKLLPASARPTSGLPTQIDVQLARERHERAELPAICRHCEGYPSALLELEDPPWVLWLRGDPTLLRSLEHEPSVAMVGARRASPYGLGMATELGRGLGVAGVPVVSGLALGIDAAAHRGALEGGGPAIAVLACGADIAYPRRHRGLYEQLSACGLVVSELPPGEPVRRWAFPQRNRIMAALASMTLLVEGAIASGSMITADHALNLGREVGAVPGRVTARVAGGSHHLIRAGAILIRHIDDLLDALYGVGLGPAGPRAARERNAAASERLARSLREVLDGAEAGHGIDAICSRSGLEARQVRAALAELELRGHLVRTALGGYERAARAPAP